MFSKVKEFIVEHETEVAIASAVLAGGLLFSAYYNKVYKAGFIAGQKILPDSVQVHFYENAEKLFMVLNGKTYSRLK